MFAIIRTGGKQYKVSEGDQLDVELIDLAKDTDPAGQSATFNEVLLVSNGSQITVGKPTIAGASVTVEVIGQIKADKVVAYKYRRREGYHRKVGHRQKLNRVKVTKISQ